jgi:hypothetical protein
MVVYGPPIQTLDLMAESIDLTLEPDDDNGCYIRDQWERALSSHRRSSPASIASTDLLASLLLLGENRTRRSCSLCASINSMYCGWLHPSLVSLERL